MITISQRNVTYFKPTFEVRELPRITMQYQLKSTMMYKVFLQPVSQVLNSFKTVLTYQVD